MTEPAVSVIVPAKNASATLNRTIESVATQTVSDWELLIIDDASSDNTKEIIEESLRQDRRIKYLSGQGAGAASARNIGIRHARGKWLHFLDADDWNTKNFLSTSLVALAQQKNSRISYCAHTRIFPDGAMPPTYTPDAATDAFEQFARRCTVAIHAILVDRLLISSLGGFDPELQTCEDWDLWQRVSRIQPQWTYIDQVLSYYRASTNSLSKNPEILVRNATTVVKRGFSNDPRVSHFADARQDGASPCFGTLAQAITYNTIWIAGMDCGRGGTAHFGAEYLIGFEGAPLETDNLAGVMLDGIMAGSLTLPKQIAPKWHDFGKSLQEFFVWLGTCWQDENVSRALQYRLEHKLARHLKPSMLQAFEKTFMVTMDMLSPFDVLPPAGRDCVHVILRMGRTNVAQLDFGILGIIGAADWHGILANLPLQFPKKWPRRPKWPRNRRQVIDELREMARDGRAAWRSVMFLTGRYRIRRATGKPETSENRIITNSHRSVVDSVLRQAAGETAFDQSVTTVSRRHIFEEPGVDAHNRRAHFDTLFEKVDPWNYTSAYEQEKYQNQLAILPNNPIGRTLELACAEGHFTVQLAQKVTELLATDISRTALERAKARCFGSHNIEFRTLDFSAEPIPGDMDLIICSEVLYYLASETELRTVARKIAGALRPGGRLVMAHAYLLKDNKKRTGFDWDSVYGGEVIHRVFAQISNLRLEKSIETELYRVDCYRRIDKHVEISAPHITQVPVTKTLDRNVARYIVWGGAKHRRAEVARDRTMRVPILMYHSISDAGPPELARYRLAPSSFKQQMTWLRANGFHTIGSAELLWHLQTGKKFHGRPVMLTFDDGLQDFADAAWPILSAHDFTAEVFLVTGSVGKVAAWDSSKGPPAALMAGQTIADLASEGMLYGSHLHDHRPIDGLSTFELTEQLAKSRAVLNHWLGHPPVSVATPYSITDGRLRQLAWEVGYRIAFCGRTGCARIGMDPLDLPRIEIPGDITADEFCHIMVSKR